MGNDKNGNGMAELEKRLWAAVDQLWATSPLRPSEYSAPVLWLNFLRFPVPPMPLLSRFSECVNDAVGHIQNLVFKNRNLSRTRDLLLPKVISGALDVSKHEIEGIGQ